MDFVIFVDVENTWTHLSKFYATPQFFLEGNSNASNRSDFDAILSAMKIYTTLKKISTKTVYYDKSCAMLKSANEKI